MKTVYIILSLLCFFSLSCDRETEVIELANLTHLYNDGTAKAIYFVISNPPKNKDSLFSLVSKHFQSFAPNDTIEKYVYYNHFYHKETYFTPRDYKEGGRGKDFLSFGSDYIEDHKEDLLIRIVVEPKFNEQEIIFYKKGKEEKEITKKWRQK